MQQKQQREVLGVAAGVAGTFLTGGWLTSIVYVVCGSSRVTFPTSLPLTPTATSPGFAFIKDEWNITL